MNHTISDSFTGMLRLETAEGYDAFFHISGSMVKLLPLTEACRNAVCRLSGTDGSGPAEHSKQWLYGLTEDNCSVAILKQSRLGIRLTSGFDMKAAQFYTPLIVKSTAAGQKVDLSTFDAIEFRGGVVDLLHSPGLAIDWRDAEIIFRPPAEYTRKYEAEVNGEHFEVVYSVSLSDLYREAGKLPDLGSACHATLTFHFRSPQNLENIERYYAYAISLFQFCAGRLNVCSEVRLYKRHMSQPILLRLNDGFDDHADGLHFTDVIRFCSLDASLPDLLKLLNEDKTKPYLEFLPKRNKDLRYVLYTDVNDLCIAFETEYARSAPASKTEEKAAARELTEALLAVIDGRKDCPEAVKTKARSILNAQLKSFSPSLKEKILYICSLYRQYARPITEPHGHDVWGISTFYSEEEFEKKVGEFIKIRNSASHARITWNDGISIFYHLKLYIYFSVLSRAGIPAERAAVILSWMFGRLF